MQIIESKSFKNQLSVCDKGTSPSVLGIRNDSIQLILNNVVRKTYYPTDDGKSIYKTEDPNS
ncbi:hypothetical protein AB4865_03605 [Capnocytophaga sp. ARDL2]|uniref:hypothetical protein n=1 Tax=Capnocytophaga sp. ARDL2 TaxID=3238809 RepID=UPI003558CAC1